MKEKFVKIYYVFYFVMLVLKQFRWKRSLTTFKRINGRSKSGLSHVVRSMFRQLVRPCFVMGRNQVPACQKLRTHRTYFRNDVLNPLFLSVVKIFVKKKKRKKSRSIKTNNSKSKVFPREFYFQRKKILLQRPIVFNYPSLKNLIP